MTKVTIELPARILLRNSGGKPVYLESDRINAQVWAAIAEGGVNIIMNNTFNSGGKAASETERLAAMQKRLDAWYAGNYVIGSTGPRDSIMGDAKRAFLKKNPDGEAVIKAKVAAVLGKDEKATFANYLKAVATDLAKAKDSKFDDEFEALLAKAEAAALKHREEQAAALANLDIDVSELF